MVGSALTRLPWNRVAPAELVVVGILCLLARLDRLLEPLDLDLSVYSTIGSHLGPGSLPYRDLFDHKQPLVYPIFWAIDVVAPRDPAGVRVAAVVVGTLAAGLMLGLRRCIGRVRAFGAAALLAVVAGSRAVEGGDLNTEHLLLLTAATAMVVPLALWRSTWVWLPVACGMLMGVAVLTKAVGMFLVPAALMLLLAGRAARGQSAIRTLVLFAAGMAAPATAVIGFFAAMGGLGSFWYSNVSYNLAYASGTGSKSLGWWFSIPYPLQWLVLGALVSGLVRLAVSRGRDVLTFAVLLWLAGALLGAKTGRRDFPHYFAPVLTPAVILVWLPVPFAGLPGIRSRLASVALLLASAGPLLFQAASDFQLPVTPYSSPALVGDLLASRARAGDRLFVAGSHPWIYATSGLKPGTRYIYDLSRGIISDFDQSIETALITRPPRFMVIADGTTVLPYLERFRGQRYRLTDRVENFAVYELKRSRDQAVSRATNDEGASEVGPNR